MFKTFAFNTQCWYPCHILEQCSKQLRAWHSVQLNVPLNRWYSMGALILAIQLDFLIRFSSYFSLSSTSASIFQSYPYDCDSVRWDWSSNFLQPFFSFFLETLQVYHRLWRCFDDPSGLFFFFFLSSLRSLFFLSLTLCAVSSRKSYCWSILRRYWYLLLCSLVQQLCFKKCMQND